MSKEYRLGLRANRDKFLEGLREKYGRLPPDVERLYLRKIMAIQNNTRGKLGELLGQVSWCNRRHNVILKDSRPLAHLRRIRKHESPNPSLCPVGESAEARF